MAYDITDHRTTALGVGVSTVLVGGLSLLAGSDATPGTLVGIWLLVAIPTGLLVGLLSGGRGRRFVEGGVAAFFGPALALTGLLILQVLFSSIESTGELLFETTINLMWVYLYLLALSPVLLGLGGYTAMKTASIRESWGAPPDDENESDSEIDFGEFQ